MVYKDVNFTKTEKDFISKIIDFNLLHDIYNPKIFDDIKFNQNYNRNAFEEDKIGYLKLWIKLVFKHPNVAFESYGISTLGYWYPNVIDRAYENSIAINDFDLRIIPKSTKITQKYISSLVREDIPFISIMWSIGTYVWILIIFIYISVKRKGIGFIYNYIPVISVWFTIMIATPVYNETRYIFCLFTSIPFLLVIPFINDITNKKYCK